MKVGDVVTRVPTYGRVVAASEVSVKAETGTVVYIHPELLYYTVEFEFGLGRRFRESYFFANRQALERGAWPKERTCLYASNLYGKPKRRGG